MLHIIISPAYVEGKRLHGRFVATLAGRQLCTSREPLLGASRILLAEGVDPETPIAARQLRYEPSTAAKRRRRQSVVSFDRSVQSHILTEETDAVVERSPGGLV